MENTPGLWTHSTLPTTFNLTLDDFGIKLFAANDSSHLLYALRDNYSITVDPSGSKYCGLYIDWNYAVNYVNISISKSIKKCLERFQHPVPKHPQHSPHKWIAPTHGIKVQYSPDATTAPKLEKQNITRVQIIASTFLYISGTVNPPMLVTLNKIGSKKASPTIDTIKKTNIMMDYAATQPDAVIRFHASEMCLYIDSNAMYLVQTKAHSCASGHYYLRETSPPPPVRTTPTPNDPILTKC